MPCRILSDTSRLDPGSSPLAMRPFGYLGVDDSCRVRSPSDECGRSSLYSFLQSSVRCRGIGEGQEPRRVEQLSSQGRVERFDKGIVRGFRRQRESSVRRSSTSTTCAAREWPLGTIASDSRLKAVDDGQQQVGDHLLQPVLVLELLEPPALGDPQPRVLLLPAVEGGLRHPELAAELGDRVPSSTCLSANPICSSVYRRLAMGLSFQGERPGLVEQSK